MATTFSPLVRRGLSRFNYGDAALVSIPACLLHRLQSALNTAARSKAGLSRSSHIIACTVCRPKMAPRGRASEIQVGDNDVPLPARHRSPPYQSALLRQVADVSTHRRLRSSSSDALLIHTTRPVTIGDRAFPVAAAKLWNRFLPSAQNISVSTLLSGYCPVPARCLAFSPLQLN